jgi:tetratricopeptide (TPR) repeat protein
VKELKRLEWILYYNLGIVTYDLEMFYDTTIYLGKCLNDDDICEHTPDSYTQGVLNYFIGLSLIRQFGYDSNQLNQIEWHFMQAFNTNWMSVDHNVHLLRFSLGKLRQNQGNHLEAIQEFNMSLEIIHDNPYVYFRRAWSYKAIDDCVNAGRDFEMAKNLSRGDPNFAVAYHNIQSVAFMEIATESDFMEEIPILLPLPDEL